jgi:flagellar protein FlgJ
MADNGMRINSSINTNFRQAQPRDRDAQLKKACKEMESVFLAQMFKEMRKTVPKNEGFMETSNAEEIFQDLLDSQVSENVSQTSNLGIGDALYEQLKRNEAAQEKSAKEK